MVDTNIRERLVAVAEMVGAKGWTSVSVEIYVKYMAAFDRPGDPIMCFSPNIHASARRSEYEVTQHLFAPDMRWEIKTLDEALTALEQTAANMPTMAAETDRIKAAKAKLTTEELLLLGIR